MKINFFEYRCNIKIFHEEKIIITSDDAIFEYLKVEWLLYENGEHCLIKHNFSCKMQNKLLNNLLKHSMKKKIQYTIDSFYNFLKNNENK